MRSRMILLMAVCVFSGCSSGPVDEGGADAPLVEGKYRLSADREAFAGIRQQVPETTRQENDEIAFIQQMMADTKTPPGRVREKFNTALSKKRTLFNKDLEKRRRDFVQSEKKAREAFSKEQSAARAGLRGKKLAPDERREAFDALEQKRRDFQASQRERRDAFEEDVRDKRKNFEDYVRETSSEFYQEHRNYSRRFEEAKKAEAGKKRQAEDEFRKMDQKPAEPLGAGQ